MRILNAETLERLLEYPFAVQELERAWKLDFQVPPRTQVDLGDGRMWIMPASIGGSAGRAAGVKLVTQFDGNAAKGLDRIQGNYIYLDGSTGEPLALLDGRALTAIRTAAVSALATSLIANPGRYTLAIFGTGVQARSHLEAMRACCKIGQTMVCGSTPEKSKEFAALYDCRAATAEECCQANLICACTSSRTPLWDGNWINPGTHINAVGNSRPDTCELDAVTVGRAQILADTRAGVLEEAGDILLHGAADRIRADLRELLAEGKWVRSAAEDITLFKSVGYALGDLVLARMAVERGE